MTASSPTDPNNLRARCLEAGYSRESLGRLAKVAPRTIYSIETGNYCQYDTARRLLAAFNLRFTLWGTQLVEWWQVDYTNKTLGSLSLNPSLWEFSEIRYFERMDQSPFIGITSGKLTQHNRSHIKVMAIDLPLSEGNGISHVLSAHMRIAMDDEIETLLPDCPITIF